MPQMRKSLPRHGEISIVRSPSVESKSASHHLASLSQVVFFSLAGWKPACFINDQCVISTPPTKPQKTGQDTPNTS